MQCQPVIGATWIGGSVAGTIGASDEEFRCQRNPPHRRALLAPVTPTKDVAKECLANSVSNFLILPDLVASFGKLGYDEMVLVDQEGWDRYEAAK